MDIGERVEKIIFKVIDEKNIELGLEMEKSINTSIIGPESQLDSLGIFSFVLDIVKEIENIDLFVFHQASKLALESLTKILKIEPDKVYINIDKIGNTVSASIPIAIKDAQEEGKIKNGYKVLCSGFGVGLS